MRSRAPRTFRNTNTAWWDASQLYGYDDRSRLRVKRDPKDPARLTMIVSAGASTAGERQGYLPLLLPTDPQKSKRQMTVIVPFVMSPPPTRCASWTTRGPTNCS